VEKTTHGSGSVPGAGGPSGTRRRGETLHRPARRLAAKVGARLLRTPRPRSVPDVVLKRARRHAAQVLATLSRSLRGSVTAPPRDEGPARLAMQAGRGTGTYKQELVKEAAAKQH